VTSAEPPEPPAHRQPLTHRQERILQVIRESTQSRRYPIPGGGVAIMGKAVAVLRVV
jgi:hypothetical protein